MYKKVTCAFRHVSFIETDDALEQYTNSECNTMYFHLLKDEDLHFCVWLNVNETFLDSNKQNKHLKDFTLTSGEVAAHIFSHFVD